MYRVEISRPQMKRTLITMRDNKFSSGVKSSAVEPESSTTNVSGAWYINPNGVLLIIGPNHHSLIHWRRNESQWLFFLPFNFDFRLKSHWIDPIFMAVQHWFKTHRVLDIRRRSFRIDDKVRARKNILHIYQTYTRLEMIYWQPFKFEVFIDWYFILIFVRLVRIIRIVFVLDYGSFFLKFRRRRVQFPQPNVMILGTASD